MNGIGIFEGFFGPSWTADGRRELATFLKKYGFEFYVYAPKMDANLRKNWRGPWSESYLRELHDLSQTFRQKGLRFGVGLSPFGINTSAIEDRQALKDKIQMIAQMGVDQIGIFFDDMKWEDSALRSQIEALEIVQENLSAEILFCPTFYSSDPILDRVFGKRPETYLSEIGRLVPPEIQILWTGPKVISPEITQAHLRETAEVLRRRPVLWDNVFANDGPKQCKFLKVMPLEGRSQEAFSETGAWAFNPMNQLNLSMASVLAAKWVLEGGEGPSTALAGALTSICSSPVVEILNRFGSRFLKEGLDQIPEDQKQKIIESLRSIPDPSAQEILAWLSGQFLVGPECLTD